MATFRVARSAQLAVALILFACVVIACSQLAHAEESVLGDRTLPPVEANAGVTVIDVDDIPEKAALEDFLLHTLWYENGSDLSGDYESIRTYDSNNPTGYARTRQWSPLLWMTVKPASS